MTKLEAIDNINALCSNLCAIEALTHAMCVSIEELDLKGVREALGFLSFALSDEKKRCEEIAKSLG